MATYIRLLSFALWCAVIGVIVTGVLRAVVELFRKGSAGIPLARKRVASGIISGLGLSVAIALLATTQLRTWNSIAMFAATAALRTVVKTAEQYTLRHS